jgi:eukaryotic-like serine/threonine-protein kinase
MVEQLSGLEFRAEIGRGSMGQVMLARQLPDDRLVAVKRLGDASHIGTTQQARLAREARALSRLRHPNVVRLLDLVKIGQELLLVLEYIDGPSLAQLEVNGLIGRPDALAVVSQIHSGLHHAHCMGVVHRDVKPGNVLVGRDGRCTLTDFGLARLDDIAAASRTVLTRPGTPLGTAPYMSPEAAMGETDLDVRSDVYSFGVVTYELLLGRLPFPAERGTLALLHAHTFEPAPRPSDVEPGFPLEVEDALLWALAKDRKDRPADVAQFWAALGRAAASAWPDWWLESDLRSLGGSADDDLADAHRVIDDGAWPWNDLSVEMIEPTFPNLAPPRNPGTTILRVLLVSVVLLGVALLLKSLMH